MKIGKLLLAGLMLLAMQTPAIASLRKSPKPKAFYSSAKTSGWPDFSQWPIDSEKYFSPYVTSIRRADNLDPRFLTTFVMETNYFNQGIVLRSLWLVKSAGIGPMADMLKLLVNGKWVDVKPETLQRIWSSDEAGNPEILITAERLDNGAPVELLVKKNSQGQK